MKPIIRPHAKRQPLSSSTSRTNVISPLRFSSHSHPHHVIPKIQEPFCQRSIITSDSLEFQDELRMDLPVINSKTTINSLQTYIDLSVKEFRQEDIKKDEI